MRGVVHVGPPGVSQPLTLAAVGSVVPVSRSTLSAGQPIDAGLAGALTALRVTRLDERSRRVAVALTAAGTRVEAVRAVLRRPEEKR